MRCAFEAEQIGLEEGRSCLVADLRTDVAQCEDVQKRSNLYGPAVAILYELPSLMRQSDQPCGGLMIWCR